MNKVSKLSDSRAVAQRQLWRYVCVYWARNVHVLFYILVRLARTCRLKEHFDSNRKTCNSTGTLIEICNCMPACVRFT